MDAVSEVERLRAENAKWRAAYERANAEVFRLAELLRQTNPAWGQPMRLAQAAEMDGQCRNQ